jgi:hypothetical protein
MPSNPQENQRFLTADEGKFPEFSSSHPLQRAEISKGCISH